MGTPRGMQTDYVRDAPEGETEWKETAFPAADADTGKITTILGEERNLKITTEKDLKIAETLL